MKSITYSPGENYSLLWGLRELSNAIGGNKSSLKWVLSALLPSISCCSFCIKKNTHCYVIYRLDLNIQLRCLEVQQIIILLAPPLSPAVLKRFPSSPHPWRNRAQLAAFCWADGELIRPLPRLLSGAGWKTGGVQQEMKIEYLQLYLFFHIWFPLPGSHVSFSVEVSPSATCYGNFIFQGGFSISKRQQTDS